MTRGRKPQPTALKLVSAQHPERINADEPVPTEGIPACPSRNREIRKIWDYTIVQLTRMRVVTPADRDALFAYCNAVLVHKQASDILEAEGLVIEGSHGGMVSHPAQKIQREAATQVRAFCAEFGLTPSARTRIRVGDTTPAASARTAGRLLSG